MVASSAKETEEKTPTRQSATKGKKTFSPIDRIIAVIVMAFLSLVNRDCVATLATVIKKGFRASGPGKVPKSLFLRPNCLALIQ